MGEIVSSTGGLGLEPRGDNRFYYNWSGEPINKTSLIEDYFRRLLHIKRFERDGIVVIPEGRRDVFRGLVEEHVVHDLIDSKNLSGAQIEAAFQIPGTNNLWYLYAARNDDARTQPLHSVDDMVRQVGEDIRSFNPPIGIVRQVLKEDYSFIQTLDSGDTKTQGELLELWGETFGWDTKQISNFAQRMGNDNPNNRTVWFSGIRNKNGQLVAASMAELIVFKGRNGEPIRIVESTEWRSKESDHIKASVDVLHSQVFESYNDATIIAECNFNRAYRAAQKSGMRRPDVIISGQRISQIHRQNVVVVDGKVPHRGLRDFVLYTLNQKSIPRRQRRRVLQLVS